MFDVVALGELLVDFTQMQPGGKLAFAANPGGAPANVLAMLSRLERKTALISKVGNDFLGRHLTDSVKSAGIDTGGVIRDNEVNTTLAFVRNSADGDRDFVFFREPGADTMLRPDELNTAMIESCRIFHFGSLSLTDEPARSATIAAIKTAQRFNKLISFDPNLRVPLWKDLTDARRQMDWGCRQCHIMKCSVEEAVFITGEEVADEAIEKLRENYPNVKILFITRGKEGASVYYKNLRISADTYLSVPTIDTTGAGDTFLGACLATLLDYDIERLNEEILFDTLRFANAAASLITTRQGALMEMPRIDDIFELMRVNP